MIYVHFFRIAREFCFDINDNTGTRLREVHTCVHKCMHCYLLYTYLNHSIVFALVINFIKNNLARKG